MNVSSELSIVIQMAVLGSFLVLISTVGCGMESKRLNTNTWTNAPDPAGAFPVTGVYNDTARSKLALVPDRYYYPPECDSIQVEVRTTIGTSLRVSIGHIAQGAILAKKTCPIKAMFSIGITATSITSLFRQVTLVSAAMSSQQPAWAQTVRDSRAAGS